jgi:hypothetical protein
LPRQPNSGLYRAARKYCAGFSAMDQLDPFMFGRENNMMVSCDAAAA